MLNFTVTKNGKPISSNLYTWDEKTRTFSTTERGLVLDFTGIDNITFKTGSGCTFKTGVNCVFNTGADCTFKTGPDCTFDTESDCTFETNQGCTFQTKDNCIFKTWSNCIFYTGPNCVFETEANCTFDTESDCTFTTGANCIFTTYENCVFKTGTECVVIRRDIFEIISLIEGQKIKLNTFNKGFKILKEHKIVIDGKEVVLSEESFKALKKSLFKD
jgi:hypothetical protein